MSASFDYYRTFYYVGKYGSFTQAARILGNNQPNITRMMNNLEAELGCRLFYRSRKGVALTPEGEKLFVHVEAACAQIQIGESEIAAQEKLQCGTLSVSISEIALHCVMLTALQKYKMSYPGVRIQIRNHSTPEGIRSVERGLVELAVVSAPAQIPPSLKAVEIGQFQEILIAGPQYAGRLKGESSLQTLAEFPIITLGCETGSYAFLQEQCKARGTVLTPSVEAATTDQILPMVAHDIGIGFVPEAFAAEAIKRGTVFRIRLDEELPPRKICMIHDKHRPLSTPAMALRKILSGGTSIKGDQGTIP